MFTKTDSQNIILCSTNIVSSNSHYIKISGFNYLKKMYVCNTAFLSVNCFFGTLLFDVVFQLVSYHVIYFFLFVTLFLCQFTLFFFSLLFHSHVPVLSSPVKQFISLAVVVVYSVHLFLSSYVRVYLALFSSLTPRLFGCS